MLFRAALIAGLLWTGGHAGPFVSGIEPVVPDDSDSVFVTVSGLIQVGDQIVDSSVQVSGDSVIAAIWIDRCQTSCPLAFKHIDIRLQAGKLDAGTYQVETRIHSVDSGQPADTSTSFLRRELEIYPQSQEEVAVASIYSEVTSEYDPWYAYVNGDTLTIRMSLVVPSGAHLQAGAHAGGDSVVVVVHDQSLTPASSTDTLAIAIALKGAAKTSRRVSVRYRANYRLEQGEKDRLLGAMQIDLAAPSLCVNLTDTISEGYCLFVDSTWRPYELITPVVESVSCIRLQPNPLHTPSVEYHLYADDIAVDTASPTDLAWAPLNELLDTLETYETYYAGQWNVVERSGSITPYWALYEGDHMMELTYVASDTDSFRSFIWRSLDTSLVVESLTRISLWAATGELAGATSVAENRLSSPAQRPLAPFIEKHGEGIVMRGRGVVKVFTSEGRLVRRIPVDGVGADLSATFLSWQNVGLAGMHGIFLIEFDAQGRTPRSILVTRH